MTFPSHASPAFLKKILLLPLCFLLVLKISAQIKTVGLTKKLNGNDENGYILFTPLSTDTTFLINKCGQRLHSWRSQYTPGLSVYLRPNGNLLKTGTYTDTVFGFSGGRGGIIEEFDWNNKLVWRYKLFNDSLCQHHDIVPMANGNILVLAWHQIPKSKAMSYGRSAANFGIGQKELWGERILELKPIGQDSAEIVWQWDIFDHIVQDIDSTLPNYGMVSQHPELMNINYALNLLTNDWIHANSLDYNEELDQVVISSHNTSEIWIVDHSTTTQEARTHLGGKSGKGGDFLYRWGNAAAYDMGTPKDRKLFRQHNAVWIPAGLRDSGCIMVFNNGWERDTAYSTVDVINTPVSSNGSYVSTLPFGPSKPAWVYKDSMPKKFYSQIISGAQRLPNGNTLVCSGVQGRFFEVTPAGKTVWEYRNPVNANGKQMDGQPAMNNQVFRCSYYPKNYSAFNGRTLVSKGPIERNSYPYSCLYETVPPKIVSFTPRKHDTAILSDKVLTLSFDEVILKGSGYIEIFQSGQLLESVGVQSDMVKVSGKDVIIQHFKPFPVNMRISVRVHASNFRDSSNNLLSKNIDTSEWFFHTIKIFPKITALHPPHQTLQVKPNVLLELEFNEPVIKAPQGSIVISENSSIREVIPVGSSNVSIQGAKVIIKPSQNFGANTLVIISMDSCFMDSSGIKSKPVLFGDWYFRTVPLPQLVSTFPAKDEKNVDDSRRLTMEFDRPMFVANADTIKIFSNHKLLSAIPVNDAMVSMEGNMMHIDPLTPYPGSSRIGVIVPSDMLKDSFGYVFGGVDSSSWHFTVAGTASVNMVRTGGIRIYPNPSHGKINIQTGSEFHEAVLYDMYGKLVPVKLVQHDEGMCEMDMGQIPAGHYLLLVNRSHSAIIEVH